MGRNTLEPATRPARAGLAGRNLWPPEIDKATVKIHVRPLQLEQFTTPKSGKQNQPQKVCSLNVWFLVNGLKQSSQLLSVQILSSEVVDFWHLYFEFQAGAQAFVHPKIDDSGQEAKNMLNGLGAQGLSKSDSYPVHL